MNEYIQFVVYLGLGGHWLELRVDERGRAMRLMLSGRKFIVMECVG